MILPCQKHLYNLDKNVIYLNGAYMSPMLKTVEDVGIKNLVKKRNPSDFNLNDFFDPCEDLKSGFGKLINSPDIQNIVPIGSVSYGMATVGYNIPLGKGDKICLLADQFPSNYYIWERLARSSGAEIITIRPPDGTKNRGAQWNESVLENIKSDVRVVSIAHVHWADGTLFDLEAIRTKCDEVGAYLIVDGTQSVGALSYDQSKIKADALICAGYKWLHGPYGIGVAYYGERFQNGIPLEESWINRYNSDDFKNLVNYQPRYREGAQRYAVGESSNFILLPMLVKAIEQLNEWTPQRFQSYCMNLTELIVELLEQRGFWMENGAHRSHHLFGIKVPDAIDIEHVKSELAKNSISVSYRGDYIRVSPGVYNSTEEIKSFANCLSNLV